MGKFQPWGASSGAPSGGFLLPKWIFPIQGLNLYVSQAARGPPRNKLTYARQTHRSLHQIIALKSFVGICLLCYNLCPLVHFQRIDSTHDLQSSLGACAYNITTNNSLPTLTGAGHQWTVSTNIGCIQWLSLAQPALKVALAGRNPSPVARTSKCGWAITCARVLFE